MLWDAQRIARFPFLAQARFQDTKSKTNGTARIRYSGDVIALAESMHGALS